MRILAIETSCDDTCIAIIKIKGRQSPKLEILSNIVSSQEKLHAKYGGVYPTLAKREHQKNLPIILEKALKEARLVLGGKRKVGLIATTVGPGLEPCLWTGVNFAKELAKKLKLLIIPVNHIEAHILISFQFLRLGRRANSNFQNIFPAICLIVSGGHTQLILMKGIGKYKILGETRDDAAGECFDKTARILGLGYPGGPAIATEAVKYKIPRSRTSNKLLRNYTGQASSLRGRQNTKYKIQLPRPMMRQKNYDFSFSGLKTAVLYDFKSRSLKDRKSKTYIREMAVEIQQAIIDVLIKKTIKAAREFRAKGVILGGGVAANKELRRQFKEKTKKEIPHSQLHIPDLKFCTDNAVMIGLTAFFRRAKGKSLKNWQKIIVNANLKIQKHKSK